MNKVFRKFLIAVVHGFGQAMVIAPGRSYVLPAEKPFLTDAASLRKDASKIGEDLNKEFR